MTYTLLFDLDDTLLDTNIESFIPIYFQALSEHVSPYVSSEVFLPTMSSAVKLMMESEDPSRTLEDVFDDDFYVKIGISKHEISELVNGFYDNIFPTLNGATEPRSDAVPLIEWAISQGCRVAIATDPLFPQESDTSSFAMGWF